MPAYSRSASAWVRSIFRHRKSATEWSGDADLGFVREGGAWVQFQKPVGDNLGQPINLVAEPGDLDATITWTNDLADGVDADNVRVQFRLPETTPVWTEMVYPITAATFGFLIEETTYQFQVRYITRDPADGQIDAEGPISEIFFTTLALSGPGTPAADPGGTGGDSIVNWPILDGGGAVGGSGCWYEYIVQQATTPASGAISWSDSAVTGSFDGDAGQLAIDFATAGIPCGELIRFKYRENCNGVTGDYQFGDAFVHVCDWDAACGGIPASSQLANALYSDPNCLFAFPEKCGEVIRDTVTTSIELGRLPGFAAIIANGPHTVLAKNANSTLGTPTLAGKFGSLLLLEDGDDFTASIQIRLEEVPGGSGGGSGVAPASFPIARFGRNVAISAVFSTTTTFKIRASWIDALGNSQSVTSTSSFALQEYHMIALTMDADGSKILYVNAEVEDTNVVATAMAFSDAGIGQDVQVNMSEFGRFRAVAAWDRVLTASEVAGLLISEYVQHMIDLGASSVWAMDPVVTTETTDSYDTQVAALTQISVHYPFDVEIP